MRVLAIDTATNVASAAVVEDGKLIGEYTINNKKKHSQLIMVLIEKLLGDLSITVSDIDLFAVANGPGSFTGLRIGVAAMKALAHSTNKPIIGISTLEALAYSVPWCEHIIIPIMDARRNSVFTASYIWDEEFHALSEIESMTIEECVKDCGELLDVLFIGDGVEVYRDYITEQLGERAYFPPSALCDVKASAVAMLALEKFNRGETETYLTLKPFYLKKSQAEREYEEKQKKSAKEGL